MCQKLKPQNYRTLLSEKVKKTSQLYKWHALVIHYQHCLHNYPSFGKQGNFSLKYNHMERK